MAIPGPRLGVLAPRARDSLASRGLPYEYRSLAPRARDSLHYAAPMPSKPETLAMTDPNPVAADPGPTAAPDPAPAPELPPLAETYPLCFDWERPKPLKIGIHLDLRARHPDVPRLALRKALAVYCNRARYLKSLKAGLLRWDLQGRPAGLVTLEQGAIARQQLKAGKPVATGLPDLPPDATPLPEENLAPGRLELAAKFSELPRPLPVRGGVRIAVPTGEWTVTAILPPKVWRRLEQSARTRPQWLAALSGLPARFADGEIALQHPTVQVFERKARPEVADGVKPPVSKAPDPKSPDPTVADALLSAPSDPEPTARAG